MERYVIMPMIPDKQTIRFVLNSRNISIKMINLIFFSFHVVLHCADSPICYTVSVHTHTHTHTHIYIYIYIYIADRCALWFPKFYILFVDICRTSWVREEPGYLSRCTYRIEAHRFKNHSPILGRTRDFFLIHCPT